jgi:WD40 repeat protein
MGLQQFAKPWNHLRAIRVFRDKTGLSATPGLWTAIETALNGSEYFILLASPAAAESHWVQKEVEHWLTDRPAKNLLVILTDGEIVWDAGANDLNWEATTALPQLMRGRLAEEPLWVDLRWAKGSEELYLRNPKFRDVVADLSSTLRGIPKDQLTGEDVRQHHKAVRLRRGAITGLAVLALSLALAAFVAFGQKTLAQRNAELARANEVTASENAKRAQANEETAKANELKANENALRAENNRKQAEENLKLAKANEKRALENQRRAEENAAEARRQSERALARQLAAQSEFLRSQRSELPQATLLAVEAVHRYPTVETDQALRNALDILPRRTRELNLEGPVVQATFDQQGKTLFVRSEKGAQVWDLESGSRLVSIQSPDWIGAMAGSRDGQKFALADHCTVTVYDARTGQQLASAQLNKNVEPFSGPGCIEFKAMDFSPNNLLIAAGGDALVTRVWNIKTGEVQDLSHGRAAPASNVQSVMFSPDGKLLASSRTGDVAVWTTADWKRADIAGELGRSLEESISFSPGEGKSLGVTAGNGLYVWDTGDAQHGKLLRLPGGDYSGGSVTFNGEFSDDRISEAQMVAAADDDGAIVWNLGDLRMGIEIARVPHAGIVSLSFSSDAKRLLTVSTDKTAGVWEVPGGKEIARLVHEAPLLAGTYSAGGKVWTVDASGIAREWELTTGSSQVSVVSGRPIGISPDGGLVAVAGHYTGASPEVWDLRGSAEPKLKGRYLAVWGGAGKYLAVHYADSGLKVDDLASGKEVLFLTNAETGANFSENSLPFGVDGRLWFSEDGRYLVINSEAWEISSGRKLNLTTAGETWTALVLSPHSQVAAVRLSDESVRVIETETRRVVARLTVEDIGASNRLIISPNGRYLAQRDFPMRLWDLQTRPKPTEISSSADLELEPEGFTADSAYLITKHGYDDVVSIELATRRKTELKHDNYAHITLSPTSPLVAIAWGNTIRLWNPGTGRDIVQLYQFHTWGAAFSEDGAYIATGGTDGVLRVWETATWHEVARLKHQGWVTNIFISADGGHLVAEVVKPEMAEGDSFVSVLRSEDPARDACARLGRSLTKDEWNQHLEGQPYRRTCPISP